MNYVTYTLLMLLYVFNVILHTLGTYALLILHKDTQNRSQRLLLINHSFCESVRHVLEIILRTLQLLQFPSHHLMTYIAFYMQTIAETGMCFIFYLAMIYITLDKLARAVLNMYYTLYWDEEKTRNLVLFTWFLGLSICVACTMISILTSIDLHHVFHRYVYPSVDVTFILIAVTTLIVVTRNYNKRKRKSLRQKYNRNKHRLQETFEEFASRSGSRHADIGRNFIVPVLLIVIFLILIVVPDLTYFLVSTVRSSSSDLLKSCLLILNAIASKLDACVYLFFLPDVRKLFTSKLIKVRWGNCLCFYTEKKINEFPSPVETEV